MRDISQEWARVNRAIEKYGEEGIDEMELANSQMEFIEEVEEAIFRAINESLDDAIIRNYEEAAAERYKTQFEINELERDVKVLESRLTSLESYNQRLDEKERNLENDIDNTKFWEVGKRKKLQKELDEVRAEPRNTVDELQSTIYSAKCTISNLYRSYDKAKTREERLEKEVQKLNKPYQSQSHNMTYRPKRGR